MRPLKILTWPTDNAYLYYLSQCPHEFYVLPQQAAHLTSHPFGANVHVMPADEAQRCQFDCIVFQNEVQFQRDQYEILSASQRKLPRIYIEHEPPPGHPTDTRHPVDDPDVLLVHVTPFNALMWDSGRTPTQVIEHGVTVPDTVAYRGDLDSGLIILAELAQYGRRLGADVVEQSRAGVALELIGKGSEQLGGKGEIDFARLPAFAARYRYLFNPTRYTSPSLALLQAMMIGMPIVALATGEITTVIENGVSGFIDTRPRQLVAHMQELARNPALAHSLGAQARRVARERFGIERFIADWDGALRHVTGTRRPSYGLLRA